MPSAKDFFNKLSFRDNTVPEPVKADNESIRSFENALTYRTTLIQSGLEAIVAKEKEFTSFLVKNVDKLFKSSSVAGKKIESAYTTMESKAITIDENIYTQYMKSVKMRKNTMSSLSSSISDSLAPFEKLQYVSYQSYKWMMTKGFNTLSNVTDFFASIAPSWTRIKGVFSTLTFDVFGKVGKVLETAKDVSLWVASYGYLMIGSVIKGFKAVFKLGWMVISKAVSIVGKGVLSFAGWMTDVFLNVFKPPTLFLVGIPLILIFGGVFFDVAWTLLKSSFHVATKILSGLFDILGIKGLWNKWIFPAINKFWHWATGTQIDAWWAANKAAMYDGVYNFIVWMVGDENTLRNFISHAVDRYWQIRSAWSTIKVTIGTLKTISSAIIGRKIVLAVQRLFKYARAVDRTIVRLTQALVRLPGRIAGSVSRFAARVIKPRLTKFLVEQTLRLGMLSNGIRTFASNQLARFGGTKVGQLAQTTGKAMLGKISGAFTKASGAVGGAFTKASSAIGNSAIGRVGSAVGRVGGGALAKLGSMGLVRGGLSLASRLATSVLPKLIPGVGWLITAIELGWYGWKALSARAAARETTANLAIKSDDYMDSILEMSDADMEVLKKDRIAYVKSLGLTDLQARFVVEEQERVNHVFAGASFLSGQFHALAANADQDFDADDEEVKLAREIEGKFDDLKTYINEHLRADDKSVSIEMLKEFHREANGKFEDAFRLWEILQELGSHGADSDWYENKELVSAIHSSISDYDLILENFGKYIEYRDTIVQESRETTALAKENDDFSSVNLDNINAAAFKIFEEGVGDATSHMDGILQEEAKRKLLKAVQLATINGPTAMDYINGGLSAFTTDRIYLAAAKKMVDKSLGVYSNTIEESGRTLDSIHIPDSLTDKDYKFFEDGGMITPVAGNINDIMPLNDLGQTLIRTKAKDLGMAEEVDEESMGGNITNIIENNINLVESEQLYALERLSRGTLGVRNV